MSSSSWKRWLRTTLAKTKNARADAVHLAILGVGNELKGDDGAGVIVARLVRERLLQSMTDQGQGVESTSSYLRAGRLLVIEAGSAPENFTGILRRFLPAHVLIVDAAWMEGKPGDVRVIHPEQVSGFSASTHIQPLSTLARYLRSELACEVSIIAIQAKNPSLGAAISPEVMVSCRDLTAFLSQFVREQSD